MLIHHKIGGDALDVIGARHFVVGVHEDRKGQFTLVFELACGQQRIMRLGDIHQDHHAVMALKLRPILAL